jgi:hypothetical protein
MRVFSVASSIEKALAAIQRRFDEAVEDVNVMIGAGHG